MISTTYISGFFFLLYDTEHGKLKAKHDSNLSLLDLRSNVKKRGQIHKKCSTIKLKRDNYRQMPKVSNIKSVK